MTITSGAVSVTVMQEPPKLEFVTWKQFHKLCYGLAGELEKSEVKFETIVSISRGGHVISRILSDLLALPIFNVSIQSYEALQQKELRLNQKLGQYLEGQQVLLVDEIVDTGRSLKRALAYLKKLKCASITSCCMHVKPKTILYPDFYVAETRAWIVYPYEIRESVAALLPIWRELKLPEKQLVELLVKGGMDLTMVERFVGANGQ